MAVDFIQDSITYQTRREYAQITDFNDFIGIEETFMDEETFTDKKISAQSFKGVKNILNPAGDVVGTVTVETIYPGHYPNLMNRVNTGFAENAIEEGSSVVEVPEKNNWKMTLSGKTAAGDSFRLQVDDSYAILSGYHNTATKTTFETWADDIEALSGSLA